ncbi:MAG: efflux RND transporter periplasmic adaptor subunit [Candidatus Rokubacteria bacterium]|nr:efflux RND transporter periplasmic adaptor subunit [Candidatus Rokubacteria bacterium]
MNGRGVRALALATLAVAASACSDRATAQKGPPVPPAVPVLVADVAQRTVPLQVSAIGNVQAYTTVAVRSQVAGEIRDVHFSEGRDVKRGDLLFTIDPRPFETALRQAEAALGQRRAEVSQAQANLARDLAQQQWAAAQEKRYGELLGKELIAREQYEQIRTNAAAMEASVRAVRAAEENARAAVAAAQAAVDHARLQLSYTRIHAPSDGRTGNLVGQRGNLVKANDGEPLVVIAQVTPIYASFGVPEHQLGTIRKHQGPGGLKTEARVPGHGSEHGTLTFINNTVDPNTGTIQLKATFANAARVLWPGQFVEVTLTLASEAAVVVPSQAIQAGQQGSFVYVVTPDLKVESRKVQPGRRLERETIVTSGLKPGERVVTDGHLRLVPGAKVEIKTAAPAKTS